MADTFGLKIGLEGEKAFKASLAEINQSFKVLGSEMKLVDSQFDKNDKSVEAMTARNQVLEKSIETQKEKIKTLSDALNNASDSFGENDKRTKNWQIQLNNAQAELNGMEKELKENTKALDSTGDELDETSKQADDFGDEIKESGEKADDASSKFSALGGVATALGVTLAAAVAVVSAACIKCGKALVGMATDGASYADDILTQSTVTGIATDKLQEYAYAAELIDVSLDTLTGSMKKNINAMKSAQSGSSSYVEAYEKLGVSVMNADGTLRDSDEVYWETIEALGNVTNETERDAIAMTLLGKSAQDLNPLIEAGSERMEELAKQAHEAGYVLGEDLLNSYGAFDDQLQYLNNNTTALKNTLGTVLLPVLTELATEGNSLLTEFTKGLQDANGDLSKVGEVIGDILPKALNVVMKYVPVILDLIKTIVISIGDAIIDNLDLLVDSATEILMTILDALIAGLPKIAQGAFKLMMSLASGILKNLPKILNAAIQVVVTLAKGIAQSLPKLIPTIVEVVSELATMLVENLPLLLNAALLLIEGLAQGLLDAIPILIEKLPELIVSIVNFVIESIPQIIEAGIMLFESLVAALPEIIASIVEVLPQIIDGIVTALLEGLPLLIQAGIDLLTSIITNLPEIIETIVTALPQIIASIVNALVSNIPLIVEAGIELFTSLVKNVPEIIKGVVKAIPSILKSIIDGFASGVGQMAEVGKNLVRGLWEGIQSLKDWIWGKVSSWASNLWDGIKDFFGIHSPSRKMAYVGDMLMEGMAKGIDETAGVAIDSAEDATKDLNDVFNGLSADMTSVPNDFNINKNINDATKGVNQNGVVSALQLILNISNFNNYSSEDIQSLTNEIMVTASNFAKRKGVVFGT